MKICVQKLRGAWRTGCKASNIDSLPLVVRNLKFMFTVPVLIDLHCHVRKGIAVLDVQIGKLLQS